MISFPEQLSASGGWQFDAQLNFMRAFTGQAFATAERMLALNISTSRASVERTANTVRQMFAITDPRELFAVGAQAQEQLSALFEYGNELFNIALDARQGMTADTAALQPPLPEQEPAQAAAQGEAGAAAVVQPKHKAPLATRAAKKLVVVEDEQPDEQPGAQPRIKAKPIARAVRKVAGKGAGLPHPLASTVANDGAARLPELKPADVIPPSAEVLELKQPQTGASKAQRKK
jgi:phasin family protein